MEGTDIRGVLDQHGAHLIGLFFPPVITYFNKDETNSTTRWMVAVAICFVAAFILRVKELAVVDAWTGAGKVLQSFIILAYEAEVVYRRLYKNQYIERQVEEYVEEAKELAESQTPSPTSPTL